jgi:RNA polymerase sigma-70 factor (ECF subfamily)
MGVIEPTDAALDVGSIDVERVWRELGPGALQLAAAMVGPHDAHDIAASAFLRVTASAGWTQVTDRRAYLFRAVRNEAQNLYRARARRWRRDLAAVRPAIHGDEPIDVDVYRALARLTLRQRSVVFLAYWHDMTEAEIADVLAMSRGTVHRDLRLARDRLRKELS